MRLEGKVALISGGARGMGADEARLFAREGASVAIADLREEEGQALESEINGSGGSALFVPLDVTIESQWQDAVRATVERFGKLDVLVNNAGITNRTPLADLDEADWDLVMDINAKGVFLGSKAAIPEMKRAGGGSIVNISSVYGIVGSARAAAYHASKGAVRTLSKATAMQYAADGIRCNSIHPGIIETPLTAEPLGTPERRADLLARTPLGRIGQPRDVAMGALYLASDESSWVTGSELVIDGGLTAQ